MSDENDNDYQVLIHYVDQGMGRGHNRISAYRNNHEQGHIVFYSTEDLQIIADSVNEALEEIIQLRDAGKESVE